MLRITLTSDERGEDTLFPPADSARLQHSLLRVGQDDAVAVLSRGHWRYGSAVGNRIAFESIVLVRFEHPLHSSPFLGPFDSLELVGPILRTWSGTVAEFFPEHQAWELDGKPHNTFTEVYICEYMSEACQGPPSA